MIRLKVGRDRAEAPARPVASVASWSAMHVVRPVFQRRLRAYRRLTLLYLARRCSHITTLPLLSDRSRMPELTPTTPLQVAIPKRAFNALNLDRLRARLVAMGSARTRFEYNERHAGIGKVRLNCTVHIATGIVGELRVCAAEAEARHESETLIACADAVAAIFRAMDEGRDRPAGPASRTKPAPN